ncbi:MAG: hypothetical protein ABGX43_09020 [Nitrospinaceae bacterium]
MIVIVEDGDEQSLPDDERKAFDSLLPITAKKVSYYYSSPALIIFPIVLYLIG